MSIFSAGTFLNNILEQCKSQCVKYNSVCATYDAMITCNIIDISWSILRMDGVLIEEAMADANVIDSGIFSITK